jgi:hypothetical protein
MAIAVLRSPDFNAACENSALTFVLITAIYFSRPSRSLILCYLLSKLDARKKSSFIFQINLVLAMICLMISIKWQKMSSQGQCLAGLPQILSY